jgi:hypothetical protein
MFTDALQHDRSLVPNAEHVMWPRRLHARVKEMFCSLRGHDMALHVERGRRICLRCAYCGHETRGWQTR